MNKNKRKGTAWETDAVKELNKPFEPDVWKRVPMSGAIGTMMHEPMLAADLVGRYSFIPFPFFGEAKVGYGGRSMTIQKEWFDKIQRTAESAYAFPIVLLKFERSPKGVKHVVAMDLQDWNRLMEYIESLHD